MKKTICRADIGKRSVIKGLIARRPFGAREIAKGTEAHIPASGSLISMVALSAHRRKRGLKKHSGFVACTALRPRSVYTHSRAPRCLFISGSSRKFSRPLKPAILRLELSNRFRLRSMAGNQLHATSSFSSSSSLRISNWCPSFVRIHGPEWGYFCTRRNSVKRIANRKMFNLPVTGFRAPEAFGASYSRAGR